MCVPMLAAEAECSLSRKGALLISPRVSSPYHSALAANGVLPGRQMKSLTSYPRLAVGNASVAQCQNSGGRCASGLRDRSVALGFDVQGEVCR